MKNLVKTKINSRNWAPLALLVLAQACGGSDIPPAAVPVAVPGVAPAPMPIPTPPPTQIPVSTDFVLQFVVPELQRFYGNVQLLDPVTAISSDPARPLTLTLAPNIYTWAQIYTQFVLPAAQTCACIIQGAPTGVQYGVDFSIWAGLNFNAFYAFLGAQNGSGYNTFNQARVVFPERGGAQSTFMAVYNSLVSMNYTYYSRYFYTVGGVNGSWNQGNVWPLMPQGGGTSGGLTIGYNSQNGFNFNLGGILGF